RRPDHRGSESATKGHGMAAGKCAPTSGGGFDRRRNQAGRENCEETGRNSNGHRKLLPTPLWSHFISDSFGSQSRASSLQTHYGSRAPEQRAHARATAAIDDCRIKNAAVFNAQGITLRRPNLQSGDRSLM